MAFTNQPASVTNAAPFTLVGFTAGGITDSQTGIMGTNDPAAGTNNFMLYEWTINGTPVPGATTGSFSMVADPWFNNAQIVCQMRALGYANGAGSPIWSNSAPAVLTVATNSTVPAISYASVFRQNGGKTVLDIRFNKPMNPASLLNATYTLPSSTLGAMNVFTNGSKNLSPASEVPTLDQYASIQVVVYGSPAFPLTLTVSSAEDAWGNAMPTATATIAQQAQLVDADVGTRSAHDPSVPGVLWMNGPGSYTIQCEGSDIWNNADGFNFAYQQVSGDFDVVVRVKDAAHTSDWSKAGLMVRETLDAASRNWNIVCDPDSSDGIAAPDGSGTGANEIECNCRNTTAGASTSWQVVSNGMAPAYPNAWVRLQRTGASLAAYYSTDGANWVQHGWDDPTTVGDMAALPATVYIGICQTAHNNDPTPTPPFNKLAFLDTVDYASFNAAYAPPAAEIVTEPLSQIVAPGGTATFGVVATGTPPLGYQWQLDNTNLPGATNATLALTNVQSTSNGVYLVVITNAYGSVTSSVAHLLVANPGTNCARPPLGLVAWWPGDGNANDLLGGHDGVLANGAAFAPGFVGKAFSLDGISSYVDLGAWGVGSTWTIEAWVNPSALPSGRRAIAGVMNNCHDWGIALSSGQFGVVSRRAGGCTQTTTASAAVSAGTWYHVAGTCDGTNAFDLRQRSARGLRPGGSRLCRRQYRPANWRRGLLRRR